MSFSARGDASEAGVECELTTAPTAVGTGQLFSAELGGPSGLPSPSVPPSLPTPSKYPGAVHFGSQRKASGGLSMGLSQRLGSLRLLAGSSKKRRSAAESEWRCDYQYRVSVHRAEEGFQVAIPDDDSGGTGGGAAVGAIGRRGGGAGILRGSGKERKVVDVHETMEESHFVWQVAAAYLSLVQASIREQIELVRKELRAEGLRVGRSTDEIGGFEYSEDERALAVIGAEHDAGVGRNAPGEVNVGGLHGWSVLAELLFDVSAGLECSRLHWLSVLHEKQAEFLRSLSEPLAVSREPETFLAAAGLAADLTFKPSRLKDKPALAFLTTNCHTQQLVVTPQAGSTSGAASSGSAGDATATTDERSVVSGGRYEMVTCGCPSAHMLKSAGLVQMEAKLAKYDTRLQRSYPAAALLAESQLGTAALHIGGQGAPMSFAPRTAKKAISPDERRLLIQKREWLLFQRMQRLPVCVSQALGALATILHASVRVALANSPADLRQWANCGFLVGWESLLSTHGKEEKMLGDTWGAVMALQSLRVRLTRREGAAEGPPTVKVEHQSAEEREDFESSNAYSRCSAAAAKMEPRHSRFMRHSTAALPSTAASRCSTYGAASSCGLSAADRSSLADRRSLATLSVADSGITGSSEGGGERGSAGHGWSGKGGFEVDYGAAPPPLLLTIGLPANEFDELPAEISEGPPLRVVICLFTQGVNEAQTVANATGHTEIQEAINTASLEWLESYAEAVVEYLLPRPPPKRVGSKAMRLLGASTAEEAPSQQNAGGAAAGGSAEGGGGAGGGAGGGGATGEGGGGGGASACGGATSLEEEGTLEVTVQSASNLKAADSNGLSNPYVTVQLGAAHKAWRTKVVVKCLAPEWHETYKVKGVLGELIHAPLLVKVMDRDWLAKDDPLGELVADLSPLAARGGAPLILENQPLANVETGLLSLEVRWRKQLPRSGKGGGGKSIDWAAPSIWDATLPAGACVGADGVVQLPRELVSARSFPCLRWPSLAFADLPCLPWPPSALPPYSQVGPGSCLLGSRPADS